LKDILASLGNKKHIKQIKNKTMGYAEAKAKDKNLDSYIKTRKNAKKGSSEYNAAQNKINKAYGQGPTDRPVTPKEEVKVEKKEVKKEVKVEKPVVKELTAMEKAQKAIASGDKEAAKESGLKGGLKRQAKRSAGKKDREMARDDRKANKAEGRADKEAEKTAKKESIKAAGSRKAARLTQKSDAAKEAEKQEKDKYNKSYDPKARGKARKKTAKDYKQVGKKEAKTDRVNKRLKNEKTKLAKKADKEALKTAGAPTTFKSFDQMDSQNAMATAGEGPVEMKAPMEMKTSPINYFKQSIKYNIREASNSSLSESARNNYAKNAQRDIKDSMVEMGGKTMAYKFGAMKGDQSASKVDYANYKGTDKGYKGKTGSSHGDQSATRRDYAGKKGGSIISKHMKS